VLLLIRGRCSAYPAEFLNPTRTWPGIAATPGRRGPWAPERCAGRRSPRWRASVRAEMSWTQHRPAPCGSSWPARLSPGPDSEVPGAWIGISCADPGSCCLIATRRRPRQQHLCDEAPVQRLSLPSPQLAGVGPAPPRDAGRPRRRRPPGRRRAGRNGDLRPPPGGAGRTAATTSAPPTNAKPSPNTMKRMAKNHPSIRSLSESIRALRGLPGS
jgi:hypothetical protein